MDLNSYDNNSLGFDTNNVQIISDLFFNRTAHCGENECLKCIERALSESVSS